MLEVRVPSSLVVHTDSAYDRCRAALVRGGALRLQNLIVRVIRGRRWLLQMGKRSILTRYMLNLRELRLLRGRLLHRGGPFVAVPNGDGIVCSRRYVLLLSHWVEEATVDYFLGTFLGCGELCHG